MKCITDFNDKHIVFQSLDTGVYEDSHLSCVSDIISKLIKEIRELKKISFFNVPVPIIEDDEKDDVDDELETTDDDDEDDDRVMIIVEREPTPVLQHDIDSEYDSDYDSDDSHT
jgi:hypothetical protein